MIFAEGKGGLAHGSNPGVGILTLFALKGHYSACTN